MRLNNYKITIAPLTDRIYFNYLLKYWFCDALQYVIFVVKAVVFCLRKESIVYTLCESLMGARTSVKIK